MKAVRRRRQHERAGLGWEAARAAGHRRLVMLRSRLDRSIPPSLPRHRQTARREPLPRRGELAPVTQG